MWVKDEAILAYLASGKQSGEKIQIMTSMLIDVGLNIIHNLCVVNNKIMRST